MIVICDIDGTLSDARHREHLIAPPKPDWDAFFEMCDGDKVIGTVQRFVHAVWMSGARIVLLTGRPERVRLKTAIWLNDNGIPYEKLLMRKDGDYGHDHVVKREMLVQHLKVALYPSEEAIAVDNSEPVCKMFRELGIPTMLFTLP